MAKIIVQEIQASSKKKEGTIYFPCLITALCKNHGMPQKANDEKDHGDFYKFSKAKFEWHKKINDWSYEEEMDVPIFPYHVIGELEEENKEETKAGEGKKSEKKKYKKKKKTMEFRKHATTSSGMPKDDSQENPKKKVRNEKKPYKVMSVEVPLKDNVEESVNPNKEAGGEMSDEDEQTLNALIKQASKDKKETAEENQPDAEKSEDVNNKEEDEQKAKHEEVLGDEAEDSTKDSYKSEFDVEFDIVLT
ncbi:uncharacterized protein LOC127104648 [Lathyrus oleraceus]|uniref:uncharacterized protein LOC127104648 n=1 Tax=Pisum sativum TaxID=3888 RepID=UPI0021D37EE4|nr:uncharacterized protein LOC127104648 [Pisum sativum]